MTEKKEKTAAEVQAEEDQEWHPSPNLFQRINAIRSEVKAVAKNADVGGQYQAVTHDDVTAMLRPLTVKHGVVSFCSLESSGMFDTGVMYGKRALMQLRSVYIVTYLNIDDPEQVFACRVEAHADDSGDKAPGKVASYAQKYADLKTFAVKTGEGDENRPDESKITVAVDTLTEDQLADLWAKADELFGDDALDILSGLAKKIFGLDAWGKIESKHFATAISWLENGKFKKKDAAE